MLDLNITMLFQLVNFFIAIYVLNILLIRPIRDIIKKRNGIMEGMIEESESFEHQASDRLANYEAELARARQDAGLNREAGRAEGAAEQQNLVGQAQRDAREIIADTRRALEKEAQATLAELRGKVSGLSASLADRLIKG